MPQTITLSHDGDTGTVTVKETIFHSDGAISLKGCDPSLYPDGMVDDIRFFSKDLTAIIQPDDAVTVERAEPTSDAVPEPDPMF